MLVLGDVAWNAAGLARFARLPGQKHLVLGNHDHFPAARYLAEGAVSVRGVVVVDDVICTHVPVHPGQIGERFRLNVHGHTHVGRPLGRGYFSVCPEVRGLAPVPWNEAIK